MMLPSYAEARWKVKQRGRRRRTVAAKWEKSPHHEGTKDTKVSDRFNSELRALRTFVVRSNSSIAKDGESCGLRWIAHDEMLFGHGIAGGAAGFADDFVGIEINLPVMIGVAVGAYGEHRPVKVEFEQSRRPAQGRS